ncbi:four-helix bundle copper-binding protein [Chryseomicrobium palamuruense]|uniref:Four-helix bundle copper-binding protein n=1 Tax=Chryseomicrobium palamuruense TaxID=682973 RepID=A0ABV8UUH7_9BACL
MNSQYQDLLNVLHDCALSCNHCFDACLGEENVEMMSGCIRLDRECADMCSYLEQAIMRNSPFISQLAIVCAEICEACAEECGKHNHDHCQRCAEACKKCSEACRAAA